MKEEKLICPYCKKEFSKLNEFNYKIHIDACKRKLENKVEDE